ncbi:MAG: replication initiation factor domain-containing protein [Arthrobacter sp.]|nr:replication initiation factor domain-containing protein [Arthrobacter sp.]
MTDSIVSIIESQADALTCSFHTPETIDRAQRCADIWAQRETGEGAKVERFRTHGYEMWLAGRVAFGRRPDGGLLKLSGDLAELYIEHLVSFASNVSRVDFALTARCSPHQPDLGTIHYGEALAHFADNPTSAEPSHKEDGKGGDTCYLGKRTSDWYFRCYNKEAECVANDDDPGALRYAGCWRYEVEVKGPNALIQAKRYVDLRDRASWVQSMLYTYCANRGLGPVFPSAGEQDLVPGFRRRSDRESKLRWLAKSVRPTLEWLSSNTDRATIMATLGLPEVGPVVAGE